MSQLRDVQAEIAELDEKGVLEKRQRLTADDPARSHHRSSAHRRSPPRPQKRKPADMPAYYRREAEAIVRRALFILSPVVRPLGPGLT